MPSFGQWVQFPIDVGYDAKYSVQVVLPTVGEPRALSEETLPCEISASIMRGTVTAYSQRTTSIRRTGRVGFSHTDEYRAGDEFTLPSGEYAVRFTGSGQCTPATERGGLATLEQDVGEPTAHYLFLQGRHAFALFVTFGGLAALLITEFARKSNLRGIGHAA